MVAPPPAGGRQPSGPSRTCGAGDRGLVRIRIVSDGSPRRSQFTRLRPARPVPVSVRTTSPFASRIVSVTGPGAAAFR